MANPLPLAFPDGTVPKPDTRRYVAEAFALVLLDVGAMPSEDWSLTPYKMVIFGADLFEYDPNDTITEHDGLTVLKTLDNRVYKVKIRVYIKHVVDSKDIVAQPASPSLGDAYLLPAAPTGDDWAGKAKNIAIWTERDWVFLAPTVGDIVYVKDEDRLYHYPTSGIWSAGLPGGSLGDGSVKPGHLQKSLGLAVEAEQNDPPLSMPGDGVAYIVGTAPTGVWLANPGDVVISNGVSWDFLTAYEGAFVTDKSAGYSKLYQAGVWVRAQVQSGVVDPVVIFVDDETKNIAFGDWVTVKTVSVTALPSNVIAINIENFSMTGIASEFAPIRVRLIRDSEAVALAFHNKPGTSPAPELSTETALIASTLLISPADVAAHDYKFQIKSDANSGDYVVNVKAMFQIITSNLITVLD